MTKKITKTKKKVVQTKRKALALTLTSAPITQTQLLFILQKTPKEHIYKRQAKGGGTWDYVTGVYVKKVLNYTFGWMWDFQIVDKGREGDLVWVQGRLTIKSKTGKPMIIKEQFGRADIKYYKDRSKGMLDYGNDLKSASTDALKKCASELGIASDVYGKTEFQEIQQQDSNFTPPANAIREVKASKPVLTIADTVANIRRIRDKKTLNETRKKIVGSKLYSLPQQNILLKAIDEQLKLCE